MAKTNAQILALIAACIAQQGNQSGLDGLAEILTELVGRSVPIEVDNIAELTAEQLDALEPGNVVVKKQATNAMPTWSISKTLLLVSFYLLMQTGRTWRVSIMKRAKAAGPMSRPTRPILRLKIIV